MKKINSLISIIVNCHNGEKYLKKSIQSVINQSYKNWELIFWDNKSSDNSKKVLLKFKNKKIKYFKSKRFTNLYEARNLAIQKARGEYISFLDTDDWWIEDKLKIQLNFARKFNNINFFFSNLYIYDQKKKKKNLYFKNYILSGKMTQHLLNNYKIGILSVLMKKKIFKENKFNTNYNIIGDFDFFVKLSIKENFMCINKPLAYYRVHENNYSKKLKIHVNELNKWLSYNSLKYKRLKFSLNKIKIHCLKLKFKSLFA